MWFLLCLWNTFKINQTKDSSICFYFICLLYFSDQSGCRKIPFLCVRWNKTRCIFDGFWWQININNHFCHQTFDFLKILCNWRLFQSRFLNSSRTPSTQKTYISSQMICSFFIFSTEIYFPSGIATYPNNKQT